MYKIYTYVGIFGRTFTNHKCMYRLNTIIIIAKRNILYTAVIFFIRNNYTIYTDICVDILLIIICFTTV